MIDPNRSGITFVNNNEVLVHERQRDAEHLSSRQTPELSSSFILHASMLDANSGKLLTTKQWGTRFQGSSIQPTSGGILVRTGELLTLYSKDFVELRKLTLPITPNVCSVNISASQDTILLSCWNYKSNSSHFDVFDGSEFKLKYSWSESPPLYRVYSISDSGLTAVNEYKIIAADFGSRSWTPITQASRICAANLVGDKLVLNLVTRKPSYGCNEISLISADGKVLMTEYFAKDEIPAEKIAVARGGRFVAVSVDKVQVPKHLFSESRLDVKSTHIAVYDLLLKKNTVNVEITSRPQRDYDFALSPDGSMLAILYDRTISMYFVGSTSNAH